MKGGWKTLGITLILDSSLHPAPLRQRNIMSSLFAHVARLLQTPAATVPASPAAALMESADLRAGLDAHHAQELRVAASAWLSVVR